MGYMSKPYTIIVRNGDLILKDDIRGNGMYIVPDGKIYFVSTKCQSNQTVKGIFVAQSFDTYYTDINNDRDPIINNDLNKSWCEKGALKVQGVLIG